MHKTHWHEAIKEDKHKNTALRSAENQHIIKSKSLITLRTLYIDTYVCKLAVHLAILSINTNSPSNTLVQ